MDQTDLRIVAALQDRGRVSNAELARHCELAPSTTLERVRRLEERGVIRGYTAVLDPAALGYPVQALVMITLRRHEAVSIDAFEAGVRAVPEVKTCSHVTGQYDYVLHVIVRDIDHLGELVKKTIAGLGGVEKQETFLVLSTVKEDRGYVVDPGANAHDGTNEEA